MLYMSDLNFLLPEFKEIWIQIISLMLGVGPIKVLFI
jgi:hypothetical protein